jgi:integrase
MRLTKDTIAALAMPAGKDDFIEWDEDLPGFGVRLRRRPDGAVSKTWVAQYRVGRQQRRPSLGDVRKVEPEAGKKAARKLFALVELGIDPAAEQAKARAEDAAAKLTLKVAADRYLADREDVVRPTTYKGARRYFESYWKSLHDRPLESIKRADVAARLQEIIQQHGRTTAARARANLSALFSWAMREGLCESNPVIGTNDPEAGIKPRERVLEDGELRAIWRACRDDDFGRIIRLLILTGCRREEIGGLRWSEINLDTGVMKIPGERTKNHHTLELTLPAAALDILPPRRPDRDNVFGKMRPFSAWSFATMVLKSRIVEGEGKSLMPWTLHDLRRSMRTGLGKLGVQPHIAELCVGHVRRGIEAIYDRHKYQREIKAALALWAEHLLEVVEGRSTSKVVPLRSAS